MMNMRDFRFMLDYLELYVYAPTARANLWDCIHGDMCRLPWAYGAGIEYYLYDWLPGSFLA